MSSSSVSAKICFNSECSEFKLGRLRPGWRLHSGDFADLCDRCASAYEEGRFCEIYHMKFSGWRCCESCEKRIHCGCIVSAYAFMLLDAGGIECLACTRKNVALAKGPNFSRPPSFFFQPPIGEKLKEFSVKNWSCAAGSGQTTCWQASKFPTPLVLQSDLHSPGVPHEVGRSTSRDRATTPVEKREMHDCTRKLMTGSPKFHTSEISDNGKAGTNCDIGASVNAYQLSNSLKKDPSGTQPSLSVPFTTPNEINGCVRLAGTDLRQTNQSFWVNRLHYDLNTGADSGCENESQNMRPQVDSQGKHHVLPRYWRRFTKQDLQNLSTISKSIITPLFEKMLSASDAGRIGRLVLPKKCAEAYLPQISHPEGLPLKVQDSTGKEWVFQFRFWPNNNSRMYVLEGVTPCIQNMQLQAGDTVTFSRLDPEGKLIMGFRKASIAHSSDQENDSAKNASGSYTNGDPAEPADPHPSSKADKSAYIAKEVLGVKSTCRKRKSSTTGLKGKRLKVENKDLIKLKLTWEEAQGLLQPPPNNTPTIIVIEGFEFEEYEDAPIIGKLTVFATDDTRSPCSVAQELGTGHLDNALRPPNSGCSKTLKAAKHEARDMEAMEELDSLGTGFESLSVSSKATTKHPRHRIGCTCIVCIQPPSGKGPKHEQSCTCTVCQMVKRRFRTLMLRREKKQTEKEETKQKKDRPLQSSDEELHPCDHKSDEDHLQGKQSTSPLKGQIDLNIRPERDEESSPPGSDSTAMRRLLFPHDGMDRMSIVQPRLSGTCSHSISFTNRANLEDTGKHATNTGAKESNSPAPLTAEPHATS